jgi:hypothetical protein
VASNRTRELDLSTVFLEISEKQRSTAMENECGCAEEEEEEEQEQCTYVLM